MIQNSKIAAKSSVTRTFVVTGVLSIIMMACSKPSSSELLEKWDMSNRPETFDPSYKKILSELPLKRSLTTPWSDTYWPSNVAGIANRWNGNWPENQFTFPLYTKEEIRKKSVKELASLSPAEKYDIFMGQYTYPLVTYERSRTSPDKASWEGMCHGWAPAAVLFEEPNPVILENSEGIKVPFGSSDIKALLSLVQGNFYSGKTIFLGGRCNENISKNPERGADPQCRDVNAGSFHLIMANEIGIKGKPFIMDVTRDLEVWNQPVFRFESKIMEEQPVSPGANPEAVKEVIVESTLSYGSESIAQWEHLGRQDMNVFTDVTYKYRLELNDKGEIVGGEWLDQQRPDFLWAQDKAEFTGFFQGMAEIYSASLAPELVKTPLVNPAFEDVPLASGSQAEATPSPALSDLPTGGTTEVSPEAPSGEGATSTPVSPPVITVAP